MSTSPIPPSPSSPRTWQEELSVTGDQLVARVRELVQAGNVRRISVHHEGRTLIEFPLTVGVVGALLAPQLAALGAIAALLANCTLSIEHEETGPGPSDGARPDSR